MAGFLVRLCLFLLYATLSFGNMSIKNISDYELEINGPNCHNRIHSRIAADIDVTSPLPYEDDGTETVHICEDMLLQVDDGYQIKVSVTRVNINPESGYLLVKSGTNSIDGLDGRIFAHDIKTTREYISLTNSVYVKVFSFGETGNDDNFSLTVSRIGEPVTTTCSPTTGMPTPPPDEPGYFVVNITVPEVPKSEALYGELINKFTTMVSYMATEYCKLVNITPKSLSSENVRVISTIQCPLNWPKRDTCMQVNFSVPIQYSYEEEEEEEVTTYELTSHSLNEMWTMFSEQELKKYGFSNYDKPGTKLVLWLSIICATILLFSVILYIIKKIGYKLSGFNIKHKPLNNEQNEAIPRRSQKQQELSPHIRQIFPPMFESKRQYYEP